MPSGTKFGDLSLVEARQAFLTDLVGSLVAGADPDELQAAAALDGLADEVQSAEISDISTRFLDPELGEWSAVLTVRTENHELLASGALHDSEFGVFGKVSLVRTEGDPIFLARRTMLEWMEAEDLKSLSTSLQSSMGGGSLTVDPPLIQVLPLALWL